MFLPETEGAIEIGDQRHATVAFIDVAYLTYFLTFGRLSQSFGVTVMDNLDSPALKIEF